jgi:transcription elongation factor Elf1
MEVVKKKMTTKTPKINTPDYVFECKKCGHYLYVDKKKMQKLIDRDCDECGEEAPIWIFIGEGNFEKR